MDTVDVKQKKKGTKDKSALSKNPQESQLISHINENTNVFS